MVEKILVVDDEVSMRKMLEILFTQEGFEVRCAESAEEAVTLLESSSYDMVISDIRMPGLSGLQLLKRIREAELQTDVVLMTAYASTDSAIKALKLGAFDYITKPFQVEELLNLAHHAFEKKSLLEENIHLMGKLTREHRFGEIVGSSPNMMALYGLIERVAPTVSTVLIQGESGTGKELIARTLHRLSPRARRPLVAVNCAGLPESLLESELFGHVKGAFTGAYSTKKGLFDVAMGGTLFLDEIADMSPAMQVKLLRVLQEKQIRPVGSGVEHPVDARIITATNQDLKKLVSEKTFREDLYYRVNVITLLLPPLRERVEDIPLITHYFMDKFARILGKETPAISPATMKLLESFAWPGNVRQLESAMERAMALLDGNTIEPMHLPDEIRGTKLLPHAGDVSLPEEGFMLNDAVEAFRAAHIRKAMKLEGGVMVRGARRLGISFRSMRYFVKKYGIQAKER